MANLHLFCLFVMESVNAFLQLNTDVVSHVFCEFCANNTAKDFLEDVPTYAELRHDPRGSLPPSFTICSTVTTPYGGRQLFFSLLGTDGEEFVHAMFHVSEEEKRLKMALFHKKAATESIPPVLPKQWARSCFAVDTSSGLIQWVVNGKLVANETYHHFKNKKN